MRKFSVSLGIVATLSCVFAVGCGDPPPRPGFNDATRIPKNAVAVGCGDLASVKRLVYCELPVGIPENKSTDPYVCGGVPPCAAPSVSVYSFSAFVTFRSDVGRSGEELCIMSESGLASGMVGQFGTSNVYLHSAYMFPSATKRVTLELQFNDYKWDGAICHFVL